MQDTGTVQCVSFNPNGLQIVSGSYDGTIKLWNTDDSQEILTHRGHSAKVSSIAFSPDGTRIVSGSKDSTIKLWNATIPNNLRLIRGHDAKVNCICFSPDGKRIASGSIYSAPKIWDALTGESIVEMNEPHRGSASIAFKHDETQVVSGETDGTIRLWDANTGNERLTLLGHESTVTSVSFSSDDTLIISAGHDGMFKLWDAVTGKEIRAWKEKKHSLKDACFSLDDKSIITTHHHGAIKRWDVASGAELTPIKDVDGSAGSPCIAVSADGTLIASGSQNTMINIWDAATGQEVNTLQGHVNPIRSLSFSPDGKRLVSITRGGTPSTAHTVKLWDVATGEELISLKGQSHEGSNIVFSPDGSTVAWASASANAATDYAIKLWDVTSAEEITVLKGIGRHAPKVVRSDDSVQMVISEGTKKTVVWDSGSIGSESASSLPLIISSGANLLLVDRSYRDAPKEKSFRQFKARLDPSFHAVQATTAEKKQDWYAATFHRAWESKGDPNRRHHYQFKEAYKKLKDQYDDQEQELADFLSPVVVEVAGLPRPKSPLVTISEAEAEDINRAIWQKVRLPNSSEVKNGVAALSQTEINSLRNVCIHRSRERQYLKTLLVAEYRLNHLKLNVIVTEMRISNLALAQKVEPEWSPAELAVIAMSHHKLGNKEKAAEYRARLDEAMKLAKYRDDEESKSFLTEVNDLLGPPTLDETDNK